MKSMFILTVYWRSSLTICIYVNWSSFIFACAVFKNTRFYSTTTNWFVIRRDINYLQHPMSSQMVVNFRSLTNLAVSQFEWWSVTYIWTQITCNWQRHIDKPHLSMFPWYYTNIEFDMYFHIVNLCDIMEMANNPSEEHDRHLERYMSEMVRTCT
jgi:hypothetical protein